MPTLSFHPRYSHHSATRHGSLGITAIKSCLYLVPLLGQTLGCGHTLQYVVQNQPTDSTATDETSSKNPTKIADLHTFTAELTSHKGFLDSYVDLENGRVYLSVAKQGSSMLHIASLSHGVGSNDLGLDRGKLGSTRVVRFDRVGPRVLLVAENTNFRAQGAEQVAVRESFAESVLWGFDVVAEDQAHVLIDATDFLVSDVHGVGRRLAHDPERPGRGGASLQVDLSRSGLAPEAVHNFAGNTELEAIITLVGQSSGHVKQELATVTPDPRAVTVRQRHSFVELPQFDGSFNVIPFDPRTGYWSVQHADFSTKFSDSIVQRYQPHHRIAPALNDDGRIADPIVYYVDHSAPPEIRQALVEGARFWEQAFDDAGLPGGFRVEILPEDLDPLDMRVNVIQWTHRATRGWSYGASVVDPRTGEILKGHVTLGSQRIRQDLLIAEGLVGPHGQHGSSEQQKATRELALARLRQLSAHEVGHTLGLAHNFAASATPYHSVMDYPVFEVSHRPDGHLDLSHAYEAHIGDWDKLTIKIGYGLRTTGQGRSAEIDHHLSQAHGRGAVYANDRHVFPGSSHPLAHRWDSGKDPIAELDRLIQLRGRVLADFPKGRTKADEAEATLAQRLTPIYYLHRYQVEAAVKSIGGVHYDYALTRENPEDMSFVPAKRQADAATLLLATLDPTFLALPPAITDRLRPSPPGHRASREDLPSRLGEHVDPVAMAQASIQHTLSLLLHPARLERANQQAARDPSIADAGSLLEQLYRHVFARRIPRQKSLARLAYATRFEVLEHMFKLSSNPRASSEVRGLGELMIGRIEKALKSGAGDLQSRSARGHMQQRIAVFRRVPHQFAPASAPEMPPGAPIGQFACEAQNYFPGLTRSPF